MSISSQQLSELIDLHWSKLVVWVRIGIGAQEAAAEEAVQEAFIRLSLQETLPDDPLPWLITVARRLAANERLAEVRRTSRERSRETDQFLAQPETDTTVSTAEQLEVRELLARLEPSEREVLAAKLWADLTWDDAAESLGCSRTTVWRTYRRAIQKLKNIYQQPKVSR